MRQSILFLLLFVFYLQVNAQERHTSTIPYKSGTLTFQYYDKEGVKIPDGLMEFTKGKYTEKGEMRDGYREGQWIIKKQT